MKDIVFVNGLSCGDGTQDLFLNALQESLGSDYTIHRPSLKEMDRSSTERAIDGIIREFKHLTNPVVIGFSLGGLWAMFLARKGFSDKVISISPALPGNMLQIDTLRLKIFGSTLLTGKPFRFTSEIARQHLMANVDPDLVAETSKYFVEEPASLIWEYALMKKYTKLSPDDIEYLRNDVKGLIITGMEDRMCSAAKQKKLSKMLAFEQIEIQCGHSPQLGPHRGKILDAITQFIENSQGTSNGKAS